MSPWTCGYYIPPFALVAEAPFYAIFGGVGKSFCSYAFRQEKGARWFFPLKGTMTLLPVS